MTTVQYHAEQIHTWLQALWTLLLCFGFGALVMSIMGGHTDPWGAVRFWGKRFEYQEIFSLALLAMLMALTIAAFNYFCVRPFLMKP